jgi:hypothetical protein
VTGRVVVHTGTNGNSTATKELLGICPAGKIATGGGGRITVVSGGGDDAREVAITASYASPLDTNSWFVSAAEIVPTDDWWALQIYVVCVDAG